MDMQVFNHDHSDPVTSLHISQKAPAVLAKSSLSSKSFPLSIVGAAESPEEWAEVEQIFYACLRTGDDKSAHLCLERLSQRFGTEHQRIMALRGLYQEAEAKSEEDIRKILQEYNQILDKNPMNIAIHKRRAGLIRSIGRPADATDCLVTFIGTFPGDTEAWCELSDLYQSQGLTAQAIFSLEEAVLSAPNAWNLHARLGELNYLAAQSSQDNSSIQKYLAEAVRRFARSVELCDDYVRGYYGLKLATAKAATISTKEDGPLPAETARELNALSTSKLKQIIQRSASHASGTYQAELAAAQALLDGSNH